MSRIIGLTVGSLGDPPRNTLVLGVDIPDAATTGVYQNIIRTTVSGNQTFSTANALIQDKSFLGIVTRNANNLTFQNCSFQGGVSTPSTAGLVNCTSAHTGTLFVDCTFCPDIPDADWNGITGINFRLLRCDVFNIQDGLQIRTNTDGTTGVKVEQSWIHDLARWTAGTTGVVHPSDFVTHNDLIQQFGGSGTQIRGNLLDARHARGPGFGSGIGHWVCVGDPAVEPYVPITLNSLPDGGPWYNLPDRGSGTEATGRYNGSPATGPGANLSAIMMDNDLGASKDWVVEDNWIRGGVFSINGGGNADPLDGSNLGSFKRNKFYRDQGNQGSGGDTTQTINFQGAGWAAARADIPTSGADANTYIDNGHFVQVRF